MEKVTGTWVNTKEISAAEYDCGHSGCGAHVAPSRYYFNADNHHRIYICSACGRPTYMEVILMGERIVACKVQVPGPLCSRKIQGLPPDVAALYTQIQQCMGVEAYSPAVLGCRKMMMHVACALEAKPGMSYEFYVDFLKESRHVPEGYGRLLKHIRKEGNDENHKIVISSEEETKQLLGFVELLLINVYEVRERTKDLEPKPPAAPAEGIKIP